MNWHLPDSIVELQLKKKVEIGDEPCLIYPSRNTE